MEDSWKIRKSLSLSRGARMNLTRLRFKGQLQSGNIRRIINSAGRMLNGVGTFDVTRS